MPIVRLTATLVSGALLLVCVACATASAPGLRASRACSLFAAPSGADTAPGTAGEPFRTAQRLADALRPGQTGCLKSGTYAGYLRITHGGRAHLRLTIRSLPGAVATVQGRIWIRAGSNYVTLQRLHIVGTPESAGCTGDQCPNIPTVAVNGNSTTLEDNNITNRHSSICVAIGSALWGTARQAIVQGNDIHGCGRLPATNYEHGIYVGDAVGTAIRFNHIHDNADRGIQLYPHAQRTLVEGNLIDANGEGILIGGLGADPTTGSLIEHNLITNSRNGANVESYFPAGAPRAMSNRLVDNCVYGGRVSPDLGGIVGVGVGFSASRNLVADPHAGGRCAAILAAPVA